LENQLPAQCLYIEGDQELLLNFDHDEAVDLFFSLMEKDDEILIHEYLPPMRGLIQDSEGNQLEHEIILSLLNEEEKRTKYYQPIQSTSHKTQQEVLKKAEFNQWLYFKVYTTPLNSEKLLLKIYPEINRFKRKKWIDDWFFIRYGDPDHHLRLRFKSACPTMQTLLLPDMKSCLEKIQSEGVAWKIMVDQYQPEINRYGEQSMSLCEQLFHWDSETILRFLNTFKGHKRELLRWQMAVLLIQEWFELFKMSKAERKEFLENWCVAFKNEPQFKYASKQSLAKQWRSKRACIDQLIRKGKLRELDAKLLSAIAAEKSLKSYPFTDALLHLGESGKMSISRIDLLNSLCHMSCNRLFPHGARANEFVIYDLMWNYYRSDLARSSKLKQKK
jgi:thiopeptide-type bacteriocin biosynthesis protein